MGLNNNVDQNISDLFFNTDVSDASEHSQDGTWLCYNGIKLRTEADLFLACLKRLGVAVPTSAELVADFLARV